MLSFLNRAIRYLFYALFFLIPLTFWGSTSELFEFNKMWLTFIITILIAACWISKMIITKKFIFKRTPLDIPIGLFLLSQIISTIFTLDHHVSLWGYYGRWNGGLLSIISYIFLYYALVSNILNDKQGVVNLEGIPMARNDLITKQLPSEHQREGKVRQDPALAGPAFLNQPFVFNILKISLLSGFIVCLWGLPGHFGYDPTCLLFRGHLDVSCWTADFQPKIRIFSTLGQPDWLAAYLAILIPISLFFALSNAYSFFTRDKRLKINYQPLLYSLGYSLLTMCYFIASIYTQSKSGFIGIILELVIFWLIILIKQNKDKLFFKLFVICFFTIGIIVFLVGSPFAQINKFTFPSLQNIFSSKSTSTTHPSTGGTQPIAAPAGELGGTDSGKIRLFVWEGAVKAWLAHPIFGTGVETFAFAYYLYRPAGHNLTSEWDYLYNKAHNEYLNYLATTGAFGLLTYLSILSIFIFLILKQIFRNKSIIVIPAKAGIYAEGSPIRSGMTKETLLIALLSSYTGILITNFFGFSVVIVNIYLFLIPALFFLFIKQADFNTDSQQLGKPLALSSGQIFAMIITFLIGLYLIIVLINYWTADQDYAYGQGLDHLSLFDKAYPYLKSAADKRPSEPVFKDELSVAEGSLALAEAQNNNLNLANTFAENAINTSDELITNYPNDIIFWKSRIRIFYALSEVDKKYLAYALQAAQEANKLAPTDAKVSYNLGVLYAQNGDLDKAISTLKQTIALKKDYSDAYFALGLVYRTKALDKNGKLIDKEAEANAVYYMKYILNNFDPNNADVIKNLQSWGEL